jgi:hypothetical protein
MNIALEGTLGGAGEAEEVDETFWPLRQSCWCWLVGRIPVAFRTGSYSSVAMQRDSLADPQSYTLAGAFHGKPAFLPNSEIKTPCPA